VTAKSLSEDGLQQQQQQQQQQHHHHHHQRTLDDILCDEENETLLEIEVVTGDSTHFDWQVIDDYTNNVVYACPTHKEMTDDSTMFVNNNTNNTITTTTITKNTCYWTAFDSFYDRICIPSDGCFHFVVGQHTNDYDDATTPTTLKVTYGGEILKTTEDLSFQSVALKKKTKMNSQQQTQSSSLSNMTSCHDLTCQLEMELFFFGDLQNFGWTSTHRTTNQASDENNNNNNNNDNNNRSLKYHRQCIPGCDEVSVFGGYEEYLPFHFRVQAGGIIYGAFQGGGRRRPKSPWDILVGPCTNNNNNDDNNNNNDTTVSYCPNGPLVQVDIDWTDKAPSSNITSYRGRYTFLPELKGDQSPIIYDYDSNKPTEPSMVFNSMMGEYFRHLSCFPGRDIHEFDNGCFVFETNSPRISFQMKGDERNGDDNERIEIGGMSFITTDTRIDCSSSSMEYKFICSKTEFNTLIPLTPIGNCQSKRPIIWITSSLSTTCLLFFVVMGGYVYSKRRRNPNTMTNNDNNINNNRTKKNTPLVGESTNIGTVEVVAIPIEIDFTSNRTPPIHIDTSNQEEEEEVNGGGEEEEVVDSRSIPQVLVDLRNEAFV